MGALYLAPAAPHGQGLVSLSFLVETVLCSEEHNRRISSQNRNGWVQGCVCFPSWWMSSVAIESIAWFPLAALAAGEISAGGP